jgi:hypothetical protein
VRARPREVNIFNMSLLDILCGALGAFCFMMLVLLPYYRPPTSAPNLRKEQADTDELLKQLDQLKAAAGDPELEKQMRDLIEKLKQQIRQLQGEVNQYAAENQQLQADKQQLQVDNANLSQKNQEQAMTIQHRQPFFALVTALPPRFVNIFLENDINVADGKLSPRFNPAELQDRTFAGEVVMADYGTALWLVRDVPPGAHYTVYVKLAKNDRSVPANLTAAAYGDGWKLDLGRITLTSQRPFSLVGTLTADANSNLSFKAATEQERQADWDKLSKNLPPPPSPTPSATRPVGPTPNALSPEARKQMAEEKERGQRIREETKRRLREREHPSPAQSPAPSP